MEQLTAAKLIATLNALTSLDARELMHPGSDCDSRREAIVRLGLRTQLIKALRLEAPIDHPLVSASIAMCYDRGMVSMDEHEWDAYCDAFDKANSLG